MNHSDATIEELHERLGELASYDRTYEEAHIEADAILCELLRREGHGDIVETYQRIGKWYA